MFLVRVIALGLQTFWPQAWPATIRGVFGDQERYESTYFAPYKGYYFTGDGARRDADGYYWITGRVDDVINVSGHRIGTAEVESALVLHESCAEAAVVGYEHPIKGIGIYAYVTLMDGVESSDELRKELVKCATHTPEVCVYLSLVIECDLPMPEQ